VRSSVVCYLEFVIANILQQANNHFAMTIGKGLLIFLVFELCSNLSAGGADVSKVASFSTVLTAIVQQVGVNHVSVAGLVMPGQDPHAYQPTPSDLKQASDARLILLSGKHLEHYLDKVQQATGAKAESIAVAIEGVSTETEPSNWYVTELIASSASRSKRSFRKTC
jgi:ABC-type Zn uptake system ZnuABC Zn-binding protein ZnuA